jgi:rhodanese-related sulfurtransferase
VPALNAAELAEKLKNSKRPFLLDVREPEEFREAHIAGAKLIPLGELRGRLNELPKDKEIVCVCASGSRSSSAAHQLASAGLNVLNLKGGMFMWQRSGLPVKKGAGS